ncbi:MAG: hypothetical protein ACI9ZV_001006 [Candidatus Azotimanducaceae bacterium]|jgi:hypothetical protein
MVKQFRIKQKRLIVIVMSLFILLLWSIVDGFSAGRERHWLLRLDRLLDLLDHSNGFGFDHGSFLF